VKFESFTSDSNSAIQNAIKYFGEVTKKSECKKFFFSKDILHRALINNINFVCLIIFNRMEFFEYAFQIC